MAPLWIIGGFEGSWVLSIVIDGFLGSWVVIDYNVNFSWFMILSFLGFSFLKIFREP